MTSSELRQKYLDFFKARKHAVISSASLIPENDSTLLFVNSGMFPLVPYLLGEKHPAGLRLTDSQKCFRTEDIDEVGDKRHNTFFEMLGNWSLGDYFKEEQLTWWFEFLFKELKLDPHRIYQSVYVGSEDGKVKKDEESIALLKTLFDKYGVKAEEGPMTTRKGELGPGLACDFLTQRIFAYRDKNWWKRGDVVGELGGPDSETFYDTGKDHNPVYGEYCHLNCDCGKFIEIGNSVFMQYQKSIDGWQELDSKNVDFGGGLERILMVCAGENSIFKTDLFIRIITKIEELSGKKYDDNIKAFEIVADHIKSATFIVGDNKGVSPSNTDQGYIVRRLLRRAIRYGRQLGISQEKWLKEVADIVINDYSFAYPELARNRKFIGENFDLEEEKFNRTLEKGVEEINKLLKNYNSDIKEFSLDGKTLFNLYQSYGFPIELSFEEINNKRIQSGGLFISKDIENNFFNDFHEELKKHQELSRTASAGKFKGGLADSSEETTKLHTAAHLLLASLRKVLGDHVIQKGSNITTERLRLDFSHPEKMTLEQITQVESLVNEAISKNFPIVCEQLSLDEAKNRGAMGVFDSKYGEQVKVYTVSELKEDGSPIIDRAFSQEICGGPHVNNTGVLGHFKIQKEEASSSGVRRIKAILSLV